MQVTLDSSFLELFGPPGFGYLFLSLGFKVFTHFSLNRLYLSLLLLGLCKINICLFDGVS